MNKIFIVILGDDLQCLLRGPIYIHLRLIICSQNNNINDSIFINQLRDTL